MAMADVRLYYSASQVVVVNDWGWSDSAYARELKPVGWKENWEYCTIIL